MARELKHIDITNVPELLRIAEEVQASREPRLLRRDSEDVAILRPVRRASTRRLPRGKPFTQDDPIWNLQGVGRSGLTDVSANVDTYLAEAYLDSHAQER